MSTNLSTGLATQVVEGRQARQVQRLWDSHGHISMSPLSLLPLGLQASIVCLRLCTNDGKVPGVLGRRERVLK